MLFRRRNRRITELGEKGGGWGKFSEMKKEERQTPF